MFLDTAMSRVKVLIDLGVKVLGSTNPVVGWILHLPVCGGDTIFHTAEDQNNIKAFLNSFVEQHSSCHDGVGLMT